MTFQVINGCFLLLCSKFNLFNEFLEILRLVRRIWIPVIEFYDFLFTWIAVKVIGNGTFGLFPFDIWNRSEIIPSKEWKMPVTWWSQWVFVLICNHYKMRVRSEREQRKPLINCYDQPSRLQRQLDVIFFY